MKASYAISLLVRNPIIKPGDSFEIEAYLIGFGEPIDNKLQIYISKKGFIDQSNPGYLEVSGQKEGDLFKFGDKYKIQHKFETDAVTIGLSNACFKTIDEYQKRKDNTPKGHIPMVISEAKVDNTPPILLHLKTTRTVQPGNYPVNFFFTYSSNSQDYQISEKGEVIHVTSWAERHVSASTIITILTGILSFFGAGYIITKFFP